MLCCLIIIIWINELNIFWWNELRAQKKGARLFQAFLWLLTQLVGHTSFDLPLPYPKSETSLRLRSYTE